MTSAPTQPYTVKHLSVNIHLPTLCAVPVLHPRLLFSGGERFSSGRHLSPFTRYQTRGGYQGEDNAGGTMRDAEASRLTPDLSQAPIEIG